MQDISFKKAVFKAAFFIIIVGHNRVIHQEKLARLYTLDKIYLSR